MSHHTRHNPQPVRTRVLEAALERRDRMGAALGVLEDLAGHPDSTPHDLGEALRRVRDLVMEHVSAADEPEHGLLTEVVGRAPRLARAATRLQAEHPELIALASETAAAAEGLHEPALPELLAFTHGEALQLLARLNEHRQKGARLLSDAYDIDLGGGD